MNKIAKSKYDKLYYLKNKAKIIKIRKIYRSTHLLERSNYDKSYYLANKNKINNKCKKWHEVNKIEANYKQRLYMFKKLKTDQFFRYKHNLRSLIRSSIKRAGYKYKSKLNKILGCSFEQFKVYLESKFTKGMTWANHGEWHMDHIITMASAKNKKEVLQLNHYTNFQPLWATSKIAKKYGEHSYIGNLEKRKKQ